MIKALSKKKFKDYPLKFSYQSNAYYDFSIEETPSSFSFKLEKKPFDEVKTFSFLDVLYPDYLEDARAYGFYKNDALVGIIELSFEAWNKRCRVSELLVDEGCRGQGIGKALMDFAKAKAKKKGYRMLILETQTCNTPAIDFYLAQGFKLVGLDTSCYSNEDTVAREMRLEFGYFIK